MVALSAHCVTKDSLEKVIWSPWSGEASLIIAAINPNAHNTAVVICIRWPVSTWLNSAWLESIIHNTILEKPFWWMEANIQQNREWTQRKHRLQRRTKTIGLLFKHSITSSDRLIFRKATSTHVLPAPNPLVFSFPNKQIPKFSAWHSKSSMSWPQPLLLISPSILPLTNSIIPIKNYLLLLICTICFSASCEF